MNDVLDSAPEQEPPRQPSPVFLIIVVFAILLILAVSDTYRAATSPHVRKGEGYRDLVTGDSQIKIAYFASAVKQDGQAKIAKRTALALYKDALSSSSSSRVLRRLGIMTAATDRAKAIRILNRITSKENLKNLAPTDRARLRREVLMWRRVFSGALLNPTEVRDYRQLLRKSNAGPTRYIAEEQVYRAANMVKEAENVKKQAESRYLTHVILLALTFFAYAVIALAGLALLVVVITSRDISRRLLNLANRPAEDSNAEPALWLSFLVYLVIFLGISLAAGTALEQVLGKIPAARYLNLSVVTTFIVSIFTGALSILILRVVLARTGASLASIGYRVRTAGLEILWGIVGYAAAIPVFGVGILLMLLMKKLLQTPEPMNPIVPMLGAADNVLVMALLFLLATIVAPVVEETFFRGILFRALRARFGVWAGIILSAAAFGLVHPLPTGFFPIFALGAVFAMLVQARESLLPSMVAHALHNGGVFLLVIFATRP